MTAGDPLWYKHAVIYELHVRAFFDSDGDGVGDFRGLTEKLDYLHDLGVTAIWLLPFYPSPLKDDGYDIADYTNVHAAYGTVHDFHVFLREAHRRGLRVITELVLNHTSDQHPWFQRARRADPGGRWRNFYVWSNTRDRYRDARIIFKDYESSNWAWDPVAQAYYWHRFYAHQPDLNYDSPSVRRAMLQAVDFWMGMGVDGLRLDAVPYLYEREGTNCENLPETHVFLKKLRQYVDGKYRDRMLLAEANQWPEDAAAYFGEGDECHMAYHFPVMPRLFMAVRTEDRFPIIEVLQETPSIPEGCQWALFLRNHDELTLEMVTDEDRDYMYRVYAQDPQARINLGIRRRLAPLLGNHHRRIELMNGLLFSLPGTPVIYYGDEIGMGDNIYLGDRSGVRTPMQWSADRNAGFSRANPQRLYLPVIIDPEYHYEAVNVEAQQNNPHSRLWWMKRLIALRKRFKAFGQGSLEFLHPENRKVLAFLRRYQDECILVLANLSRFVHCVELNLSEFKAMVPVEMFGRTAFPPIGEHPYFFTLGPHTFYWFALERQRIEAPAPIDAGEARLPTLTVRGSWDAIFRGEVKIALEEILPAYLNESRWFGGKARQIKAAKILDTISVSSGPSGAVLGMVEARYTEGEPELYMLPLTYASEKGAAQRPGSHAIVARLRLTGEGRSEEGVLYDAMWDTGFCMGLLEAVGRRRHLKGRWGEVLASPTRAFRKVRGPAEDRLDPAIIKAEQSNTSAVYGDRLVLKIFRRLEQGINPDLEIGRFLTERTSFAHIPPVAGALEYRRARAQPITVGILQGFVPNQGDAWTYTLDALGRYFERALAHPEWQAPPIPGEPLLALSEQDLPALVQETVGPYLASAELLGRRTAELHVALTHDADSPDFAPEPLSDFYRQALYHGMLGLTDRAFQLLRRRLKDIPKAEEEPARRVLDLEGDIRKRFRRIRDRRITAMRIRCHGDYHLGQVLYTGKDFVIIDFEGEPARPLSERRLKRSALRDVAGMLRSFHYAAYASLFEHAARGVVQSHPEAVATLEAWARFWYLGVSATFFRAYLDIAGETPLVPQSRQELQVLLDVLLLEKAVYELGYELNSRPDWVKIPLQGILQLLEAAG
ncbi:MAG: maltose alpha-D-glucosyltransferase [Candidatus Methylomirabilales bacterium]